MAGGFRVNTGRIIHETLGGEVVAIDLVSGSYFSMKGAAQVIWDGVAAGVGIDGIKARVANAFDTGSADPSASILGFLEELASKELIVPADPSAEAEDLEVELPRSDPALPPYQEPVLSAFSDMQDLILLDPVHDVDPEKGWPHPVDDLQADE